MKNENDNLMGCETNNHIDRAMTNSTHTEKCLEILNAYNEGKDIWRHCLEGAATFNDYKIDNIHMILHWLQSEPNSLYVRKEPELRPYNNAKEFMSALREHGPYYIQIDLKEENFYMLPNSVTDNGFCTYNDMFCTFKGFMERFEWQDGTPCGIKE